MTCPNMTLDVEQDVNPNFDLDITHVINDNAYKTNKMIGLYLKHIQLYTLNPSSPNPPTKTWPIWHILCLKSNINMKQS